MYFTKAIFALLFTISAVLKSTDGCSCLPTHPQAQYCNSDFVILATVKREFIQNKAHEEVVNKIYKVKIRKEFKVSEKAKIGLKHGKIYTYLHGSMCGVDLDLKKTYLIMGNMYGLQPHITLCKPPKLWSTVSHRQRKGVKLLYGRGCDCQPQVCFATNCRSPANTCAWNWSSVCERDHGICLKNVKGKCQWTRSFALKKCMKEGQRKTTAIPETTIAPWDIPTVGIPDPYRLGPKEIKEELSRTEPSKYQRVGYYHYNKVAN